MIEKSNNRGQTRRLNSRLQETPIAIIGMASVFANARNLEGYWDNIVEKIDAIIDVPASRWKIEDYYSPDSKAPDKTYCKRGGFIPDLDFDPMEFGLPPNILEVTDIAQLLALVVARDVLEDAGLADPSCDRDKVGIVLGVGGGQQQIVPLSARLQGPVLEKVLGSCGIEAADRAVIIDKFKKAYVGWEENSFPGMLGNVIAGRIANRFDLGGTNCVVDAACAGSLAAMKLAISDLLEYRSEVMISGGICCDNSPFMYMSFSKTPAFTTNENVRSFDEDSKGMMVGEGIGMLALKRLEDAERDGDRVYAVIKGIGTSSDGRFKSIYAPRPDGQAKALRRAYEDAGFDPSTVGLIEAHGTGTIAGDAAEFSGLVKFFGPDNPRRQYIGLGSVKSQIGHTKAAAGSAGMIKTALALHHKVLPATINVDRPNHQLDIENSPFYLNTETRPWMSREDGIPRRAGVSSFGFGGSNFHFVLEEHRPSHTGRFRLNQVAEALILSDLTEAALVGQLESWAARLSVGPDEEPFVFNQLVTSAPLRTPGAAAARVGFAARNGPEALAAIRHALAQFESRSGAPAWSLPGGIFYRSAALAGTRTVALFPGQGSQYLNMGAELACNFPPLMAAFEAMDREFTLQKQDQLSRIVFPTPVFSSEARDAQEKTLQLTQFAQPAIGAFSMGAYRILQNAGFVADFTAGHSFGEWSALWAAGVLDDGDFLALARSRGQAMSAPLDADFDRGTMIAVVGDPALVAAEIKGQEGVSIANYNSRNQVVVAGPTKAIQSAFEQLKAKGFRVVQLSVSAAFHTPLVGHAQKPLAQAIDKVQFHAPKVPVFSNGTGKAHSEDPTAIQTAMKSHMLESVHFVEQIENLYAAGGRIFVEFGPKNVLTKLVESILADKTDVLAVAVNANPKKPSDSQYRLAAVELAVAGVELDTLDPYNLVSRAAAGRKKSPMTIKLNAAPYVSDKTRKNYADALVDGYRIQSGAFPGGPPQIVEKVVERVVYRDAGGPAEGTAAGGESPDSSMAMIQSLERSVGQLVQSQKDLLQVHEQYLQGPTDYARTVQSVLSAQGPGPLPESLDRTLSMYHEFQTDTLRVHENFLSAQTRALEGLTASIAPTASVEVHPGAAVPLPKAVTPAAPTHASPTPSSQPQSISAAPPPSPRASLAPTIDVAHIQNVMMKIVAEKTGYPGGMLDLDMDMEADLGIDSIKRVEILGAVQEEIPGLPELKPEDLAELRTLGQIVGYMHSKVPAGGIPLAAQVPSSRTAIDVAHIQSVMMRVVAIKTGYPEGMLELDMDMEADLGIDSIKRVEILGAVQEEVPGLPELKPEDLAELRTLGQIVDYMNSKLPEGSILVASSSDAPPLSEAMPVRVSGTAIDLVHIQKVMMQVVAEKTGYPEGMLELDMDMEADLGIDSIKRVEILGKVQEEVPGLPELKPEDLAELRTLGQIVDYMHSMAPGATAASVAAIPSATQSAVTELPPSAVALERSPSAVVVLRRLASVSRIEAPAPGARALVVDNGQAVAVELAGLLCAQGWNLVVVTPSWVRSNTKKAFPKTAQRVSLGALTEEQVSALVAGAGALDAVIYLHPQLVISGIEFPATSKQGLELAFLLAKLCRVRLASKARASFMTATWQGGHLGYQGDLTSDLVQGGLAGLVKTLGQEWPTVFCRAVDLSASLSPGRAAAILADEFLDADLSLREVAHDEAGRSTLRAEATDSYSLTSGNSVDSDSVFLVSGGARGVTAACVARLARASGATFILLGRSAYPSHEPAWAQGIEDEALLKTAAMQTLINEGEKPTPVKISQVLAPVLSSREIAASIARIEKAGGRAKYLSVDVTDSTKLKAALAPLIAEFGAVNGLIHGAGVLADKLIEQKTLADFDAVYRTKVDGLASLLASVTPGDLKHFVLFSSAAGFYGNPAQSDYSMANEILNKTALRFKALHPEAQVLAFNWGPWDGGMVTPELKRMFASRGVYIIPQAAGAELLVKELTATTNRSPQILAGNDMKGGGEQKKKPESCRVIKALRRESNPFLADHVIGGHSVLPTVAAIAWMAEAAEALYPGFSYAGLESYQLYKGVILDGSEATDYALDLVLAEESADALTIDVKVSSDCGRKLPLAHYGARLRLQRSPSVSPLRTLPQPSGQGKDASIYYEDGTLFHGPSLRGLVRLLSCDDQGLILSARIDPSVRAVQGEFPVDSSNLFANDLVYQAMLVWMRERLGKGSLPSSTGRWTAYREVEPGEPFFLALSVVVQDATRLLADLDVVDASGRVLAEVRAAEVTISASLVDAFKRS